MRLYAALITLLLLTGCARETAPTIPSSPGAIPNSPGTPAKQDSPAPPAASYDGTYVGTVNRGYEFKFTVVDSQVKDITANVLESCNNSSTSNLTTVYLEGPFPIAADGKVSVEGKDEVTKGDYRFSAALNADGTAAGKVFQEYSVSGLVCTIYELEWTAKKQ